MINLLNRRNPRNPANGESDVLQQVTNGFQAASKIKSVSRRSLSDDDGTTVMPGNVHRLNEMLQIIAEHSPDLHRTALGDTLQKSGEYYKVYRDLKQHFKFARGQRMNMDILLKTLTAVRPSLSHDSKAMIDKILKIYEILKS